MRQGTRKFPRVVHLANIPLKLKVPESLTEAQRANGLGTVELKTAPWASKPEVQLFLKEVYGVETTRIATANLEGARSRSRSGRITQKPSWKKVYATLKQPFHLPTSHLPRRQ